MSQLQPIRYKLTDPKHEPRPSGSDQPTSSRTPAQRYQGLFALAFLALLFGRPASADTLLAGNERLTDCKLVACRIGDQDRDVTLTVEGVLRKDADLIRWGEPAVVGRGTALVLADGSRLVSDRAWSPLGLVRVGEDSVRLRRGKGWTDCPRAAVRWIVLDAEAACLRLEELSGEANGSDNDTVLLVDGDRIDGRVAELTSDKLTLTVAGEPIETPLASVAAVQLAGESRPTNPVCLVGWADGSLVRAERFTLAEDTATAEALGCEIESAAEAVVFVQPLGGEIRYLSDLEPVDYRHTPYLDLAWPYARDHGLRGGALRGGGVRRAKGLAVPSAARLVYRLDGYAKRFRADLAAGDPPAESSARGSVVFRVYLVKDGQFVSAFESGIVRAGDPAEPIDLNLTDAAALALVVDYADNGDAGDEALWLDARLEN